MPRRSCIESGCKKRSQGQNGKCTAHGGGLRCKEPECKKSAIGKTNKCVAHGGGVRCVVFGCNNAAQDSNTNKCKAHGGGVRCVVFGCNKSIQGKTDKCIEHGGGARCVEPGCNTGARYKSDKCVEHGGGVRCIEPNCKKGAIDKTKKCVEHGGGKRCAERGCNKSAKGKTDKCIAHGGGIRCVEPGCKKSAQKMTDRCIEHGGGPRCPHCITWTDSRMGSNKYDGYCATCFKREFPEDPRSKVIYAHTKEIRVRNAINERFEGFLHDKPLYTGHCDCTMRRRVDHRKLIGSTLLCIETDEFAHRGYDPLDEEIRYHDLYMVHSGKWIFIRFNPDGKGVDMEDKLDYLMEEIRSQISRVENEENTDLLEVIKLFY